MPQFKALPSNFRTILAPSLAQRVNQLRQFRNMTVQDLAKASRFPIDRIEDLEAGLETWLSASDRQLLANALGIEPSLLQAVEARASTNKTKESLAYNEQVVQQISATILNGGKDLECPDCGSILKCNIQRGTDLEGYPIAYARAFCIRCPFVLK